MDSDSSQQERDRSVTGVFDNDKVFSVIIMLFPCQVISLKILMLASLMKIATENRHGDVPLKIVRSLFEKATLRKSMEKLLWFNTAAKIFPSTNEMSAVEVDEVADNEFDDLETGNIAVLEMPTDAGFVDDVEMN